MSDFWNNKVVPALNHPVLALHAAFFLVLNLGMLKIFTSLIWQRRSDIESDLRLLASELSLVVFVIALVAGAMAVVYRLQGRSAPEAPDEESFGQRLRRWSTDPFFMLTVGIYAVAFLGLIATLLLMLEVTGFGPVSVWSWWATRLFFTLVGVLVLVAIRALADVVGEPALDDSSPTNTVSASDAEVENQAPSSSESEEKSDSPTGPGLAERLISGISTPRQQLHYGAIAAAYLGLIFLVLDMWSWNERRPGFIWQNFFWELAIVVGGVGAILLLARLVEVASHTESDAAPDKSQTFVAQLASRIKHPGNLSVGVLIAIGLAAGAFGLINIWTSRNQDGVDFWSEVMWTMHLVIPAVMFPVVLWSLWTILRSAEARASSSLLFDPYRLAGLAIIATAYAGMIDFVFSAWDGRDNGPARIWDVVGEDLFNVAARVAVFIVLRAIIAAVVLGDNQVPQAQTNVTEAAAEST